MANPEPLPSVSRVLEQARAAVLQGELKMFPRANPWASDLDPASCLRRQVLEIVAPETKAPLPPESAENFRAGRAAETRVLGELREAGVEVIRQQESFEMRHRKTGEKIVGGKVDGVIAIDSRRVVAEVKLVRDWAYDRINTEEDFYQFWWMPKYPYQLHLYMVGLAIEDGVWLLTDGRRTKPIETRLNYEKAEAALAFAEQIVEAVKEYRLSAPIGGRGLPPFTKDTAQCLRCAFFKRSCQPEIETGPGAEFSFDEQTIADLERWYELRGPHREYESLDKRLKARLKVGNPLKIVGPFVVEVTTVQRGAYSVEATEYAKVSIERIAPAVEV